jgi:glutamate formiminotransferase
MNLTNYKKTPIFRVVGMVRREAQRYVSGSILANGRIDSTIGFG